MNPIVLFNVFIRDFRKQKKRMSLTVLAIAWGTISIMLLLAFGEGLQNQMDINQKGLGEGIAILWGGQTRIPFQGMGIGRRIRFTEEDVDYLKQRMPELRHVAGEYVAWGMNFKRGDKVFAQRLTGVYPCYEDIRTHYPEAGGRFVNDIDMEKKRRVVFLGPNLKEKLFGPEDAVGEQVLINSVPFTVIGVMQDKKQMGMYNGPDVDKASIPATTFSALYGYRYFNLMVVQPVNLEDMEIVKDRLYEVLGARHRFSPDDKQALAIWDVYKNAQDFNAVMVGLKIFLGIIGGMSLLIAGVGVANIMYVAIKERTREIGIKMALGAKRLYILWQFLLESLIIVSIGGVAGISISYAATEAFKRISIQSDVLDFMGRPTVSTDIGLVVVVVLGIIGFLSGIFPAIRAASVNPVEALRYE